MEFLSFAAMNDEREICINNRQGWSEEEKGKTGVGQGRREGA